jgi:hypothetical protein
LPNPYGLNLQAIGLSIGYDQATVALRCGGDAAVYVDWIKPFCGQGGTGFCSERPTGLTLDTVRFHTLDVAFKSDGEAAQC